jgi:basic membrane protein A and related proteins
VRKILIPLAVVGALVLASCGSSSPAATNTCSKTFKVGFVTDIGKLGDKGFNDAGWKGVQDAAADSSLCVQAKFLESKQPTDYAPNIQQFIDQGYNMVVAAGFLLGDDTLKAAKANPNVKFTIVDSADFTDATAPSNFTGLLFKQDQGAFLVGALAALMSKTNHIGGVYGLDVPAVVQFRKGYENGAKYVNPSIKVDGVFHPAAANAFADPDWGKARAQDELSGGADVIFAAGGATGNGALLAAKEAGKPCIGVDVDQYLTYPDVDSCLVTSAEKHISVAVKTVITDAVKTQWPSGGVLTFDLTNDGVGLAPYHQWDSKVSADIKSKLQDIMTKIKNGTLKTGAEGLTKYS